jgi:hypothetical protein
MHDGGFWLRNDQIGPLQSVDYDAEAVMPIWPKYSAYASS